MTWTLIVRALRIIFDQLGDVKISEAISWVEVKANAQSWEAEIEESKNNTPEPPAPEGE